MGYGSDPNVQTIGSGIFLDFVLSYSDLGEVEVLSGALLFEPCPPLRFDSTVTGSQMR